MTVEVSPLNILGGAGGIVTGFADTLAVSPPFARGVVSPPSENWSYILLGGNPIIGSPFSLGTFNLGVALPADGNGLGIGTFQYGVNPAYVCTSGITPIVTYVGSLYYAAQKKFVQVTYNNGAGTVAFVLGWMNYIDQSGQGGGGSQNICHDAYTIRLDTQGLLQRWNSLVVGGTTLHASLGGPAQNDVNRLSIDQTVPGQVSLIYTLNGVAQYTVVDNSASRVGNSLFPIIGFINAGAGASAGLKNFSCGIGL